MSDDVFNEIEQGLQEAIEAAEGRPSTIKTVQVCIPDIDVKQLRRRMHLTQKQFSDRFGFNIRTVQDWEQGRKRPERSNRLLLAVIAEHPEVIDQVLQHA